MAKFPMLEHGFAKLKEANISFKQLDGIAFTKGPGLLGSLVVGTSFAKGLALGLKIKD